MGDLRDLKKKILLEDKVEELLEQMGCERIKRKFDLRYEAQLPDKFNAPNPRAVQVYLTENLPCKIRNLMVSGIDIFGLVSYIVFDIYDEDEQLKNIPKSKRWICEKLGYLGFEFSQTKVQTVESLKWLKEIKRQRKRKVVYEENENKTFDDDILNQFEMYPHQLYIDEGISYEIQKEFQIGYDIRSSRIVYPMHNRFGEIVSIKGRTIEPNYEEKGIYKFIYLINYNKSLEFYNWHRALYYILEKKEAIIFEAEKGCWLSSQWNFRNCLAIGGDDLSAQQVGMIKELNRDIKIIIALDKDKKPDDIKKQSAKFGRLQEVYAMYDKEGLLQDKDSPFDRGESTFQQLYEGHKRFKLN